MKSHQFCAWHEILSLAVGRVGKFAVYVSNGLGFVESDRTVWDFVVKEVFQMFHETEAREYLSSINQGGVLFFDNEEKARKFYKIFEQELTDSSPLYACLYNSYGQCLTENT